MGHCDGDPSGSGAEDTIQQRCNEAAAALMLSCLSWVGIHGPDLLAYLNYFIINIFKCKRLLHFAKK